MKFTPHHTQRHPMWLIIFGLFLHLVYFFNIFRLFHCMEKVSGPFPHDGKVELSSSGDHAQPQLGEQAFYNSLWGNSRD